MLPDFETRSFSHLLPSLDKALITTNDLLTLEAQDVAKRAQLPVGELRKLIDAVVSALHQQLGFGKESTAESAFSAALGNPVESWSCISTLDDEIDAALGGGIPPGYLVEVTGERYFIPNASDIDVTDIHQWRRQDPITAHTAACCAVACTNRSLQNCRLHFDRSCPLHHSSCSITLLAPSL